jgi:hypothetical protein
MSVVSFATVIQFCINSSVAGNLVIILQSAGAGGRYGRAVLDFGVRAFVGFAGVASSLYFSGNVIARYGDKTRYEKAIKGLY